MHNFSNALAPCLKALFKLFIPPIIITVIKWVLKKTIRKNCTGFEFEETSLNWDETTCRIQGYSSENILIKCRDSLLKVKNGEYPYERDSVLFSELILFFPLLSSLFYIALQSNKCINLMDFGGSLGSTYFQNKDLLKQANIEIHWNVVEQEHFVRCGKEHFENDELKFSFSIKDVLKTQKINACLLSSVLQYLKNPFDLLDEIYENNIEYVIIDRTLSVENKNDVSTIQNVQKEIYEAKYPAWFFSIDKFIAYLQIKYSIIYKWDAFGNYALGKYNVKALGYLLKRK